MIVPENEKGGVEATTDGFREEDLAGYDPFDALRGTRVPAWLRGSARGRQIVIQVRKRLPIDLASVLGITPFLMATSLGFGLSVLARHARCGHRSSSESSEVRDLLLTLIPEAHSGGWGYEFDVQTRWAHYPKGTPNVVATYFVGRGLVEDSLANSEVGSSALAMQAATFVGEALLTQGAGRPYVRYTPSSEVLVHNGNLLGAALLCVCGRLAGNDELLVRGLECARTSVAAQRGDGGWPYGDQPALAWEDNFHTAYNLDALNLVVRSTGDEQCRRALELGIDHWMNVFFDDSGRPLYYPGRSFPVDINCAATAVDVAARLSAHGHGTAELARSVHVWTLRNMLQDGDPVYRVNRWGRDSRRFVRWGAMPWRAAIASLAIVDEGREPIVEGALATDGGGEAWRS